MSEYTLSSYEPVIIELSKPEVPDCLIDKQIKLDLEPYAHQPEFDADHELALGDSAYVTIENAVIDGEPATGLNLNKALMHVGSGNMPQPFDEQIIGMKAGETRVIVIAASVDDDSEEGSMEISMRATVDSIVDFQYPELTDELVQEHFPPFTTVEQFRQGVKNQFQLPDMPKNDPRFLRMILKALADRLETLPSSTQLKPKQNMDGLKEECAITALTDHLGIELTEEEAVEQLPGDTPEERRRSQESFEDQGLVKEMYDYARRVLALKWLVENSRVSYV